MALCSQLTCVCVCVVLNKEVGGGVLWGCLLPGSGWGTRGSLYNEFYSQTVGNWNFHVHCVCFKENSMTTLIMNDVLSSPLYNICVWTSGSS